MSTFLVCRYFLRHSGIQIQRICGIYWIAKSNQWAKPQYPEFTREYLLLKMTKKDRRTYALIFLVCAIQFFNWFFFLDVNATAKLFLFLLGVPLLALIFRVKMDAFFTPWPLAIAVGSLFWLSFVTINGIPYGEDIYAVGYLFIGLLFVQLVIIADHENVFFLKFFLVLL